MRPGFQVCAGIRQGCPLSPLLFAVSVDPILQTIQRTLQSATVRAYADDLVTVVDSLEKALPILVPLFRRFALASGLHLNFSKVCFGSARRCVTSHSFILVVDALSHLDSGEMPVLG